MNDVEMALAEKLADSWEPLPMVACGRHVWWKDWCPLCAPEFDEARWAHIEYFMEKGLSPEWPS